MPNILSRPSIHCPMMEMLLLLVLSRKPTGFSKLIFAPAKVSYSFSVLLTSSICLYRDTITVMSSAYADSVTLHPISRGMPLSIASSTVVDLQSIHVESMKVGILDGPNV